MLGYIPVSPATSNMYGPSQYSQIKVKTLFIYGSKDKNLGKRGSESFRYVPEVEIYEIAGGTHSCYIDYPIVFNQKILTFIDSLLIKSSPSAANNTDSSWKTHLPGHTYNVESTLIKGRTWYFLKCQILSRNQIPILIEWKQ